MARYYKRYENTTLRVSMMPYFPLADAVENNGTLESLYGTWGAMFSNATKALGIRLKLQNPDDKEYGSISENGVPFGPLYDISTERADVAVGPHPVHYVGFVSSSIQYNVHLRIVGGLQNVYNRGQSDSARMLFTIMLGVFGMAVLLGSIAKFLEIVSVKYLNVPKKYQSKNLIFNFIKGGFLEATKFVRLETSKIIFGFWILGCLIFTNLYTANMKMAFVVLIPVKRMQTVDDVLQQKNVIPYAMPATTGALQAFGSIRNTLLSERIHKMNGSVLTINEYWTESTLSALVNRKAVLLVPPPTLNYMLPTVCSRSNGSFYMSKITISSVPCTTFYRKTIDQQLVKHIDIRMRWLIEGGFEDERWFPKGELNPFNQKCFVADSSSSAKITDDYRPLDANQIQTLFMICACLQGLAFAVLILEIAVSKRLKK